MCFSIPEGVLDTIQTQSPHCRLHVTRQAGSNECVEIGTTSSPHMASLTFTLLSQVDELRPLALANSNAKLLGQQIAQATSLPATPSRESTSVEEQAVARHEPAWITPLSGTRLESLHVRGLDPWVSRARSWMFHMDWASLTSLNIDYADHWTILTEFIGRTPNLENFRHFQSLPQVDSS